MPRVLKDWITGYSLHTEHTEAPDRFHLWTAVSTIAGALRRRVWINMGYWKWYPNFFIVFVAPPGIVAKSTTAGIGMSMLKELDYIKFGPASASWQAFVMALANSREDFLLPSGEYMSMCALNIVASELGTFLDPSNREQRDVLTHLWDCETGPWVKLTKKDGEEIVVNPWVNLIGGTTPSWLAENITDHFTGAGLASRMVFVYADKPRKIVSYPQRHIPTDFSKQRQMLIHDLNEIAKLAGEFTMTEAAFEWGDKWNKRHKASDYSHIPSEKFKPYLARKQTHLHKLAMILAASQGDDLIITEKELIRADKHLTEMEHTLSLVFGQMNREQEALYAADIVEQVRAAKGVARSELYRDHFMRTMTWDTYEKVLRSVINAGMVRQVQEDGVIRIQPVYPRGNSHAEREDDLPSESERGWESGVRDAE